MFDNIIETILKYYGEMTHYSFNLIIKDYCGFPKYLPVPFHMEHGWTILSEPAVSDLKTKQKIILVFSKRREKTWKENSNIPVYIMGAPFVHYRRIHKIERDLQAKGTVAFPAHSSTFTKSIYNVDKLCEQLLSLDECFKPISISLLSEDINRELEKKYLDYGFNIVSAGNRNDMNFAEKYYNILKKHKYATGNYVGSSAFYCVEMGIPYFILGDIAYEVNDGRDMNVAMKNSILDHKNGRIAYDMFNTGPTKYISEKQKQYVYDELGVEDCISSKKMNKLLWKYCLKSYQLFFLYKMFKRIFIKIIKAIMSLPS